MNIVDSLPTIKNISNSRQGYKISVKNPSQYKNGYEKLPDLNWIQTSQKIIFLDPNQESKLEDIHLFIPSEKSHYNQHYQAQLSVETDGAIALAVSIPIWIETESNKLNSSDFHGFCPSLIEFETTRNRNEKKSFYLRNQYEKQAAFTIFVFTPPKRSGWGVMPPSAGYEWLGNEEGITIEAKGRKISDTRCVVLLKPKSAVEIKVLVNSSHSLKGKEAFLVAVAENTREWNIARIRMSP